MTVTRRTLFSQMAAAGLALPAAASLSTDSAQAQTRGKGKAPVSKLYNGRKPLIVIEEYHLVKEGKEQAVIDYYLKMVEPVLREFDGYMGMTILSPFAGPITNPSVAPYIGIAENVIVPHLGLMLDGEVRTDRQLVMHSVLRGTFNLMYRHYFADETSFANVMKGHDVPQGLMDPATFPGKWQARYGANVWDQMAKEYFSMIKNHWDVAYRFIYSD
jgi:hypothetical protein